MLRTAQREVDRAYEDGLKLLKAGRLDTRISPQLALGNYIDAAVRENIREILTNQGINRVGITVNNRAYNNFKNPPEYVIPDLRVYNVGYDFSLQAKNYNTPQVRNFFDADFRPDVIIIIRPSQLGRGSTYAVTRPRK